VISVDIEYGSVQSHRQSVTVAEVANVERPNSGNAIEVAVDVDDTEPVVQSGLGDQQVGNGYPMPHAVVMSEVSLQGKGAIEDVGWGRDDHEGCLEFSFQTVEIARRAGGIQLFEFTHGAYK